MSQKDQIKVYRLFYPQIAFVVASRKADHVEAVAINSVISGSSDPPQVVWAMKRGAAILDIVRKSKSFTINWMDSRYVTSVDFLGFKREGNPKTR